MKSNFMQIHILANIHALDGQFKQNGNLTLNIFPCLESTCGGTRNLNLFFLPYSNLCIHLQWSCTYGPGIHNTCAMSRGRSGEYMTTYVYIQQSGWSIQPQSISLAICFCATVHYILFLIRKNKETHFFLLFGDVDWKTLDADMRFSMYCPRTWFSDFSFRFSSFTLSTLVDKSVKWNGMQLITIICSQELKT